MKLKSLLFIPLILILLCNLSYAEDNQVAQLAVITPAYTVTGGGPVATFLTTTARISIIDGTAFIWLPVNDISAYAGTTGSSTPYRIEIDDTTGKWIKGYLGSQGAGETLDDELLTNGDFATNDETGWTDASNAITVSANAAQSTGTQGYVYQTINIYKKLVKQVSVVTATAFNIKPEIGSEFVGNYSIGDVTITRYLTGGEDYGTRCGMGIVYANAGTTIDDCTLKQVLDGPATYSLHIVFAKDGGTRNWTSIDSGFDWQKGGGTTGNTCQPYHVYIYAVP